MTMLRAFKKLAFRSVGIGVFIVAGLLAHAVPEKNETQPPGFYLIPKGLAFPSFKDFSFELLQDFEVKNPVPITSAQFEIRSVSSGKRVALFDHYGEIVHNAPDLRQVKTQGWYEFFDEAQLRRIGSASPGIYDLAFLINGKRASNVARFTIDPRMDVKKLPVVNISMIQSGPRGEPRLLAAGHGPSQPKTPFVPTSFLELPLVVDQVTRNHRNFVTTSISGPTPAGQFWWALLDDHGFEPPFRFKEPHSYDFEIPGYPKVGMVYDPQKTDLDSAWDQKGENLPPAALLPTPFQGRVLGKGNQPMAGISVSLSVQGNTRYEEMTDLNGAFAFPQMEGGTYCLNIGAGAAGGGSREDFVIDTQKPVSQTFLFDRQYEFSGRVLNKQGQPATGITLSATWQDHPSGFETSTQSTTDSRGCYRMVGPYPLVSYVGICDGGASHTSPKYHVSAGSKNIDFKMGNIDEDDPRFQ